MVQFCACKFLFHFLHNLTKEHGTLSKGAHCGLNVAVELENNTKGKKEEGEKKEEPPKKKKKAKKKQKKKEKKKVRPMRQSFKTQRHPVFQT